MKENKWNKVEEVYKNHFLILNLFFIFLLFFSPNFLSFTLSFNFSKNQA